METFSGDGTLSEEGGRGEEEYVSLMWNNDNDGLLDGEPAVEEKHGGGDEVEEGANGRVIESLGDRSSHRAGQKRKREEPRNIVPIVWDKSDTTQQQQSSNDEDASDVKTKKMKPVLNADEGYARLGGESDHSRSPVRWVLPRHIKSNTLGGVFTLHWLNRNSLPFSDTNKLNNPWNDNKPVKIGRDGQEIEPLMGETLCKMFEPDESINLRPIAQLAKHALRRKSAGLQPHEPSEASKNGGKIGHAGPLPKQSSGGAKNGGKFEERDQGAMAPSFDTNVLSQIESFKKHMEARKSNIANREQAGETKQLDDEGAKDANKGGSEGGDLTGSRGGGDLRGGRGGGDLRGDREGNFRGGRGRGDFRGRRGGGDYRDTSGFIYNDTRGRGNFRGGRSGNDFRGGRGGYDFRGGRGGYDFGGRGSHDFGGRGGYDFRGDRGGGDYRDDGGRGGYRDREDYNRDGQREMVGQMIPVQDSSQPVRNDVLLNGPYSDYVKEFIKRGDVYTTQQTHNISPMYAAQPAVAAAAVVPNYSSYTLPATAAGLMYTGLQTYVPPPYIPTPVGGYLSAPSVTPTYPPPVSQVSIPPSAFQFGTVQSFGSYQTQVDPSTVYYQPR